MFENILPALSLSVNETIALAVTAGLGLFFVVYLASYVKLALFGALYGDLLKKAQKAADSDEYGRSVDFFFARALSRKGGSYSMQKSLVQFKNDPHGKNRRSSYRPTLYATRADRALNNARQQNELDDGLERSWE